MCQHKDGMGTFLMKTRTHVSCLVNTVATDGLVMQESIINQWLAMVNIVFIRENQCSSCQSSVNSHWAWVMHICVGNLTIIGSDNGLSPGWRQAIIWTNAGILLIGPIGTHLSEILIEILTFSFKKMHLNVSAVKSQPFCLSLNVLTTFILPHSAISLLLSMIPALKQQTGQLF